MCSVGLCIFSHSKSHPAWGPSRTAVCVTPSEETSRYSDSFCERSSRCPLKDELGTRTSIFFLSSLVVLLFVDASHLPVLYSAVRGYLCQTYKQSLQVTVLISALWLPIRFSWGLWEQLVYYCKQPDWNQGSLAWHESDLLPLCLMPTYHRGCAYRGTQPVPDYLLFCYEKAPWPSNGLNGMKLDLD